MEKITCAICNAECHAIAVHLRDNHKDVSLDEYREQYPDAPLLSEFARTRLEEKKKDAAEKGASRELAEADAADATSHLQPMHKIFSLGPLKAAMRPDGEPVMIEVLDDGEWAMQVPDLDNKYIFPIEQLKVILMGLALNIPTYLWGHAGTGKTTIINQIACRTNRPLIRVQHTGSTEESHILGSMAANADGTYFDPGPLPLAMKYGWIYLADEYDFAFPQVLSVYQPVLEGHALVIKEAPADSEWRVIHPHPNFRMMATGNTNGAGDESGLYMGTNVQNAANYERYGIVEQIPYMPLKQEAAVVSAQGGISLDDAERLVRFAHRVRDAFEGKKIRATLGPRVLINAAQVAVARASFMKGIQSAFINRLSTKDREIVTQIAQRELEV